MKITNLTDLISIISQKFHNARVALTKQALKCDGKKNV